MKKAYVFPGQGSQYPGMAKDLYESNEVARMMLERANEILGFRITDIMFEGTAEELKLQAGKERFEEAFVAIVKGVQP